METLQWSLRKFGYYAPECKVDGNYGGCTKQAVEDLQGVAGDMKEDGVAKPKTSGAIVARNTATCPSSTSSHSHTPHTHVPALPRQQDVRLPPILSPSMT